MTLLTSPLGTPSMQEKKMIPKKVCHEALRSVYWSRFIDDKMSKLVRQNKGGTFFLSTAGHELIGTVAAHALQPKKDWGFPYYRDRAFAIGLGCCQTEIIGAFLGRDVAHHSGGRMMPEHFSQKDLHIPCQSSCVGSQFLQAVGTAKSAQLRKTDEVVYVSAGEGATSQGDFHEALNFSCLHRLPIVFVIQDNDWAISVPSKDQTTGGSIAPIARGYEGLSVFAVDGTDYEKSYFAVTEAVDRARKGLGPSLVVAKVVRLGPHSSSDDPKKYKEETTLIEEKKKDPLPKFEKWLLEKKIFSQEEMDGLKKQCFDDVEKAALLADKIPFPKPQTADKGVFKEFSVEETKNSSSSDSVVIMDALNEALVEEMERDPHVVVFGQDVAHGKGGVFGITRGLTEKFGEKRCFNTPLAESTIVGVATGLSFDGKHKPVAEIQFCDYSWTAMNQLINELASIYYRSNGEWNCPVVIRMPYGGYIQGGPYHSQSIEAYLSHCPGLKVVIPSNASDAKRLLKTAIRDPNPVVFLEHKALYRQRAFCARPSTGKEDLLPFGKANIVREGSDLTLLCWGMMAMMSYEVAENLEKEGISVEVVDLRTLVPLDEETILRSIKKTGKLLIAHEAVKNCGFGAELAARVAEKGFLYLDAPISRVTAKDCMVPYSKVLEEAVLPQKEDIEREIRKLALF